MAIKQSKIAFKERLATIKPQLPRFYGAILKNKYPSLDTKKVYNVTSGAIIDWDILNKLGEIVESSKNK